MQLETTTANILLYFKNNFETYLKKESATITLPKNYKDGDVDILVGEEVNFIFCLDEINFTELENTSDLMELVCTIFIIFKLKQINTNANKTVKQYANALYNIINEKNSIDNNVNYTHINKIEFYETTENNNFNTKILACQLNFYKEI